MNKEKEKEVLQTLKKLGKGYEFANYKKLCEILRIPIQLGGSSKISQIKHLQRLGKIEQIKGTKKYVIKEIYEEIIPKPLNKNVLSVPQCNMSDELFWKSGVYKIQKNNIIYIGSATKLRRRFLQHYNNSANLHKKTYQLLQEGGVFEVLWILPKDSTQEELRQKEQEYIDLYKRNVNYILLNNNDVAIKGQGKQQKTNKIVLTKEELQKQYKKHIAEATDKFFHKSCIKYHLPKDFDIEAFKTEMINKL